MDDSLDILYGADTLQSVVEDDQYLAHVGKPHEGHVPHSGRYPWGSGENAYQRARDFVSFYEGLKNKGWTDKQIAESSEMTINELRARRSISQATIRAKNVAEYRHLTEKGWSTSAIARKLGMNESSVRELKKVDVQNRQDAALNVANLLADQVKQYKYVEVGKGIEKFVGISSTKFGYALQALKDSGEYRVQEVYVDQGTSRGGKKHQTRMQILVKADTPIQEVYANKDRAAIPTQGVYSEDDGETWTRVQKPVHIDPKRVFVRYTSDDHTLGGVEADGIIELRRGVDDISLGKAHYAQVRIAVGKDKYMKGVALYSDDIPDGYDIVYNTNKTRAQADKVFKEMSKTKDGKIDYKNPFGATIKTDDDPNNPDRDLILCQRHYIDSSGKKKQSALNIVNEEGDWQEWGRTLSSQFLSKQSLGLARKQLKIMYDRKKDELMEIMGLTNPTIKANLLKSFAEDCDSSAAHLQAAAIAGSGSHVIIPIKSMKANECYAPNYENGTRLVLVRYPHAGTFEAAELIVNNNNKEAKRILGEHAPDAVGINHKVAGKLSGADFDGDTVMCIPNDSGEVITTKALKQLEGYEPKILYAKPDGVPKTGIPKKGEPVFDPKTGARLWDNFDTQRQMGEISNLITDMTLKKAGIDEIARAVRHSMTVIDAEKHNLDWKQSYIDNQIESLKRYYQGVTETGRTKGASTLISMAKGEERVLDRREGMWVKDENGKGHRVLFDPDTGEQLFEETGTTYTKWTKHKDGTWTSKDMPVTIPVTHMSQHKDAHELSSGTAMENVYADHANRLKSLAASARKEFMHTEAIPFNKKAEEHYKDEVNSLKEKYDAAVKHKPYERRAVALCDSLLQMKIAEDPSLGIDKDRKKKERGRLLAYARKAIGHKRPLIKFTDKEYEAIQAGAIKKTFLENLIKESDMDHLKSMAMPRKWNGLSPAKLNKAQNMLNNGYTQLEVAQAMGVSTTTLINALKGGV